MPLERIYIARHGFRLDWDTTEWTSPTGTANDAPLSEYGKLQAASLAQHFLSMPEHERPTAVFSSAWYRCLQTSMPTAKQLGLPIYVEQGVGEWCRPATPSSGLRPRPGVADSLKQHFSHIDTRYKVTWLPSRRGENIAQIHERAASFLHAFFARLDLATLGTPIASDIDLDLGRHKNVIFVGHAASVIATAQELVGDGHSSMRVGCCSLSILVPKLDAKRSRFPPPLPTSSSFPDNDGISGNAGVGQWKLIQSAAADFLPNGAEGAWGFRDVDIGVEELVNGVGMRETEGVFEEPGERGLQIELPSELSRSI